MPRECGHPAPPLMVSLSNHPPFVVSLSNHRQAKSKRPGNYSTPSLIHSPMIKPGRPNQTQRNQLSRAELAALATREVIRWVSANSQAPGNGIAWTLLQDMGLIRTRPHPRPGPQAPCTLPGLLQK